MRSSSHGTDGGVIYEYDEVAEEFHLRASHRMEEEVVEALRAAPVRLGEGATGRAATMPGAGPTPEHSRRAGIHWHVRFALCLHGLGIDLFWRFRFSERGASWGR